MKDQIPEVEKIKELNKKCQKILLIDDCEEEFQDLAICWESYFMYLEDNK